MWSVHFGGMKVKLSNQNIINRSEPCLCGCGGKDPWHARKFRRAVTVDLDDLTVGLARFPWGIDEVDRKRYEINGRTVYGAWKRSKA